MPPAPPCTPPLAAVTAVVRALRAHGAVAAVGGSGLLAALGLAGHVRDWDVTTDAPTAVVLAALRSTRLAFVPAATGNGLYATQARFVVLGNEHEVDVLVGFAVRLGDRVVPLPTRVTRHWRGLPIADPAVWLRAYQLIGREESAARLQAWVRQHDQPQESELPD